MLTLTSALRAAQARDDVEPVVSAVVGDGSVEAVRLSERALVYAVVADGDLGFDAVAIDASHVGRIKVDGAGNVSVQIVDLSAPTWGSWTKIASGAYPGGPCCLCSAGDALEALFVAADGHTILDSFGQVSTGSWSAVFPAADAGAGFLVTGLAASVGDPTLRFFYVVSGGALYEAHIGSNGWTTPVGDGGAYPGTALISAAYREAAAPDGDGDVFVLVSYGSPSALAIKQFHRTAGSWGGLTTLRAAGESSGYRYGQPFLLETSADQRRQIITWVEHGPTGVGDSVQFCVTPSHSALTKSLTWGEVLTGITLTHGLRVARVASNPAMYWMFSSNAVWRAPAAPAQVAFAREEIVDFRIEQRRANRAGSAQLTVLNDGGKLATAGQKGDYLALRPWSQVAIAAGYRTAAGAETVVQTPLWIESIAFRDDVAAGVPLLTLFCVDAWGMLDRLINRTVQTFTDASLDEILRWLCWQVCGDLALTGLAALSNVRLASFVVHAGESFGDAARRVCDRAGIALRFRTLAGSARGVGWDSVGRSVVSWANGASAYGYGPADHPITQGNLAPRIAPGATSIELTGASTVSVGRGWDALNLLGHEITGRLVDKTLGSQAATDAAATAELALLASEDRGGEITTLANVGLELGDRITITIESAGVLAEGFTVAGLLTSYSREHGLVQTVEVVGANAK